MTIDPIPKHHALVPATTPVPPMPARLPTTALTTTEPDDPLAPLRHAIRVRARDAGVERIEARYCGGYDSGAIEDIALDPEPGDAIADLVPMTQSRFDVEAGGYRDVEVQMPLTAAIDHFLGEMLTRQFDNWFDGDIETEGTVVWHLADDRLTGEHTTHVRQSEHEEWEV